MSLKAVLLRNGNTLPSIPLNYAVHMKETCDNMVLLLYIKTNTRSMEI